MEYQGRRNRRGRDRRSRQYTAPQNFVIPNPQKRWSLLDGFTSFFIMTSLIAIMYLMLDYHCSVCNTKYDLTNITKNIDDIAVNISLMKESYYDLEKKVIKFSYELPKIEGQIELLESIANTMGSGDFGTPKKYNSDRKLDVKPKCALQNNFQNAANTTRNEKIKKVETD